MGDRWCCQAPRLAEQVGERDGHGAADEACDELVERRLLVRELSALVFRGKGPDVAKLLLDVRAVADKAAAGRCEVVRGTQSAAAVVKQSADLDATVVALGIVEPDLHNQQAHDSGPQHLRCVDGSGVTTAEVTRPHHPPAGLHSGQRRQLAKTLCQRGSSSETGDKKLAINSCFVKMASTTSPADRCAAARGPAGRVGPRSPLLRAMPRGRWAVGIARLQRSEEAVQ